MIFCVSVLHGQGQYGVASRMAYADGFAEKPGIWGTSAYPARLGEGRMISTGLLAERLYGTDLSYYELGFRCNMGALGMQVNLSRAGTPFMAMNKFDLAFGKNLGKSVQIGIRAGYGFYVAESYGSYGAPSAGLGLGVKLSDKFSWLLQADQVNGFFTDDPSVRYILRTGWTYRFSPLFFAVIEIMQVKDSPKQFMASLHYRITDEVIARLGCSNNIFNFSCGYRWNALSLEVHSAWHLILGMSAGASISYQIQQQD